MVCERNNSAGLFGNRPVSDCPALPTTWHRYTDDESPESPPRSRSCCKRGQIGFFHPRNLHTSIYYHYSVLIHS